MGADEEKRIPAGEKDYLSQIGELAKGLVHEIRNPLNAIKLNAGMIEEALLVEDGIDAEGCLRMVRRIKDEVEDLHETVQEFLSYAGPSNLSLESLDVNSLLRNLAEFVEPECFGHGVALQLDLCEESPRIKGDRRQIMSAVLNLVINSREAIEQDGTITIRTRAENDGGVAISVIDTGGGISPEIEGRVFNSFFTTKEGGTGLGLGIVRRIVEAHGGRLELINHQGTGLEAVMCFSEAA